MWTKPLQHCNLPDSQDLGYDDVPLTNTVAKTTGHSTRGSRQWWRLKTVFKKLIGVILSYKHYLQI
jgi:hypothetical protein